MASGIIFRGWGFAGIFTVAAIYASCAVSKKAAYVFLCVIRANDETLSPLTTIPSEIWAYSDSISRKVILRVLRVGLLFSVCLVLIFSRYLSIFSLIHLIVWASFGRIDKLEGCMVYFRWYAVLCEDLRG